MRRGARRDGAAVRRERIRRMEEMLRGAGLLPLRRFLATYEYVVGVRRRTAREHLAVLEDVGRVFVDEAANTVCHAEAISSLPYAHSEEDTW